MFEYTTSFAMHNNLGKFVIHFIAAKQKQKNKNKKITKRIQFKFYKNKYTVLFSF